MSRQPAQFEGGGHQSLEEVGMISFGNSQMAVFTDERLSRDHFFSKSNFAKKQACKFAVTVSKSVEVMHAPGDQGWVEH